MTLEFVTYDESRGFRQVRFIECPLCGHEFEKNEERSTHFLNEHEPEDAGLAPIGERRSHAECRWSDCDFHRVENGRTSIERTAREHEVTTGHAVDVSTAGTGAGQT